MSKLLEEEHMDWYWAYIRIFGKKIMNKEGEKS